MDERILNKGSAMKKRWWNERTRVLLTLELAVVLPAAALIGYSLWNLHTLKRDKGVEAAIQRDLKQVLYIAEKQINARAYDLLNAARVEFPCPTEGPVGEKLETILARHPYAAHVFLYDAETGWVFRSQPGRRDDPYFRKESQELDRWGQWVKMEAKDMFLKARKMEQKSENPYFIMSVSMHRADHWTYQTVAFFTVPNAPADRLVLGGLGFDAEYLQQKFFPEVVNELLAESKDQPQAGKDGGNELAFMLHPKKDPEALAASAAWDGGKPEMEQYLEGAFPGLALGVRFHGTTVEALAWRFLRNNLIILIALSLALAVGVFLTYRNVTREMALARLKSDFVANVSHELRTPLALIRLYAETLELGRLSAQEKLQDYYSIMRKESERLTALINNILDFSRIEAGRKEYDFRETDLAELVRSTLESYRYQIEQQGFELQLNIADDVPPLRVDREAMARSLLNLVNNALKYCEKQKYVGVRLYRDNGAIKLEVTDHGIGIPRNEQSKIFEKFYRVGDPLVHNTKGSGLGLSLVRHIVQAHGGQVFVESAPGKGSHFTIALPLQAEAHPTATARPEATA